MTVGPTTSIQSETLLTPPLPPKCGYACDYCTLPLPLPNCTCSLVSCPRHATVPPPSSPSSLPYLMTVLLIPLHLRQPCLVPRALSPPHHTPYPPHSQCLMSRLFLPSHALARPSPPPPATWYDSLCTTSATSCTSMPCAILNVDQWVVDCALGGIGRKQAARATGGIDTPCASCQVRIMRCGAVQRRTML